MVKDIITVAFNSLEVEKTTDGNGNNTLFTINTPPIIIRNKGILKVSNFCHIGTATGHADNMYLFKIAGVIADTSRFFTGSGGGNPLILTTTFNNNRSLYDENVITLTKQTINAINITVDSYLPSATINNNLYITNGGSGYLVNQRLKLTIVSTDYEINVNSIDSNGGINSISFIDTAPTTEFNTPPITTLTTSINGSGASLTAVLSTNAISSITINNAGLGYEVGQVLAFSGGGGSNASIFISTVGPLGQILTFTIVSGGSAYSTAPTVSINPAIINNGSSASLTAVLTANAISSITINNAGSGYKVGQTLAFSGGGGSGANISIATVGTYGNILTFTITSGGTGYSSAPTVSINSTTEIIPAQFAVSFGQILNNSIPTSLNFSITFIIEQDVNE
jgi:hypothetical protein